MTATEERLRALMLRGLDGDASAHRQLLADLAIILRRYFARAMRRNPADVEDLVQECLITVHTRRESYDRSLLFTPWLFAIARYKKIDHYRRGRLRVTAPLDGVELTFGIDDSEAVEAALDLEQLMSELPERERDAIRQVKLEGRSVTEAARLGGISESYVKVSIHRGLKKLMARVRNSEN